jgi:hypothetical protein
MEDSIFLEIMSDAHEGVKSIPDFGFGEEAVVLSTTGEFQMEGVVNPFHEAFGLFVGSAKTDF